MEKLTIDKFSFFALRGWRSTRNLTKIYRTLLITFVLLLITSTPALAKAKKIDDRVMGPTGIRGVYQPKWPHTPTEIKVTQIEKGSPASSGGLKVNDLIVGFGKEKFKRHPLWGMAEASEKAEASGGTLTLLLKSGKQVDIKLSPLGAYSGTAPYNCPKTDKIISQAADALVKQGMSGGATRTALLGLMATGEKKYLDVVSKAIHNGGILKIDPKEVDAYLKREIVNPFGSTGWTWGYNLIALGEYYLLTKDEKVLPAIRTYAIGLARGQDGLGLWGHKMATGISGRAPGYGVMNQPSISNLMGMIIAQKCGIKDPILDKGVKKTYSWISSIAGRGGFSYGSGGAYKNYFNNNGTSGSAAICMSLKGNQKGATFFSQIAATSYDSLTSGHASSFFNPLWTPLGTSLSGPKVTHQFFKRSLWYFTGERHWAGGFPEVGNAGAVAGQALLMYCLPRKALLITGREADESIFIKDAEVTKVIMRSKIDYEKKSTDELLTMLNDTFIQVRLKTQGQLAKRSGKGKGKSKGKGKGKSKSKGKAKSTSKGQEPNNITPKVLAMMKEGNDQMKVSGFSYLAKCNEDLQLKHTDFIVKTLRDRGESIKVRVAAATTLASTAFGKKALPYFNDILKMVLEKRLEPDPFDRVENELSKVLMFILKNSETKPLDKESKIDLDLLYKVSNKFFAHKRQNVRQAGAALAEGIAKDKFYLIANNIRKALTNDDPSYHSYSQAINVPAIDILANLNIKEGLDFLVGAIFNGGGGGGKWSFKYKALMKALPKYGANAEPYIKKFETHKNINRQGTRYTAPWQKVVKQIREDKNPPKLISIDEVIKQGRKD